MRLLLTADNLRLYLNQAYIFHKGPQDSDLEALFVIFGRTLNNRIFYLRLKMTRTFLLLTFLLACYSLVGQEIVQSEISVITYPVSECNACNGGAEVSLDIPGVKTFNWYDNNNVLLFSESTNNNWSQLNDLCVGSYFIEVSHTSSLINSVWISVSESDIEMGLFGDLFVCSSEEIDLNLFELTNTTNGGTWVGSNGQIDSVVSIEEMQLNEYYSYQINNNGCENYVIYPVSINDPANSGDGTTYIICEDFEEFELIEPMAGDPEENGVWYDSENNISDGAFNPETDEAEQFTYLIDSVAGCPASFSTLQIVKNVIPYAGEDGVLLSCSVLDETVQLIDYLNGEPELGGSWYDMNNQLIEGVFSSSTMEEGIYRYTIQGSVPCPSDIAYVSVEFVDELLAGDGGQIQVCSTSGVLEMNNLLTSDITEGGVWINEDEVQGITQFDPVTENSQTFIYQVTGVGCETVQSSFAIEVEQFESAGEDQSVEFCEFSDEVDLNDFLSADASSSGVWMLNNEIIESSIISGLPIEETFIYSLNHQVCETEASSINIIIYENPLFPSLSNFSICENSGIINLDELANLEEEWLTTWVNLNSNLQETTFDTSLGVPGNYQLTIDPQNICGSETIEISIESESNDFENGILNFEFCSSESGIDISSIILEEIGSDNFALQSFPNTISTQDYIGTNIFQAAETNLDNCEPSIISVELNIIEFNNVNPNSLEIHCESQQFLDLEDYSSGIGEWFFNNELLESTTISQSVENSGLYSFQPNNHPVCPQVSQIVELQFEEPFDIDILADQTLCLGENVSILSPLSQGDFTTEWLIGDESSIAQVLTLNSELLELGENEVNFTVSNGICQNSSSFMVTINPIPEFEIQSASSYCSGEEISLYLIPEIAGEVSWFIDDGLVSNAPELQLEMFESVLVTAAVLDESSCFYESQEQIQVLESPESQISIAPQVLCAPVEVNLSFLTEELGQDHYWLINEESFIEPSVAVELNPGDQIDLYLTIVSENGCVTQIGQENYLIGTSQANAEFSLSASVISDISQPIEILNNSLILITVNGI